jgi:hypothetical protein
VFTLQLDRGAIRCRSHNLGTDQQPPKQDASCLAAFTAAVLRPLSQSAEHSCGKLQFAACWMH